MCPAARPEEEDSLAQGEGDPLPLFVCDPAARPEEEDSLAQASVGAGQLLIESTPQLGRKKRIRWHKYRSMRALDVRYPQLGRKKRIRWHPGLLGQLQGSTTPVPQLGRKKRIRWHLSAM